MSYEVTGANHASWIQDVSSVVNLDRMGKVLLQIAN